MQSFTVLVLACLFAVAMAYTHYEVYPAVDAVQPESVYESVYDTPVHERSQRTKRGLLLLKKKLLLGALGLKAAKVGAVGVAGALALKKKASVPSYTIIETHPHPAPYAYSSHGPNYNVEVHSW